MHGLCIQTRIDQALSNIRLAGVIAWRNLGFLRGAFPGLWQGGWRIVGIVGLEIKKLRDLDVEMDKSVAVAYGWDDLDFCHNFYETERGIRFSVSEEVRREVLRRLLKLNHERYEEEVQQGLHGKKEKKPKSESPRGKKSKKTMDTKQGQLF